MTSALPPSRFDLLAWLSADVREQVEAVATVRRVAARETVYCQSDPGDEMFRVQRGSIRLSVMTRDGRELLYKLCQVGDCFGTSSVVDGEPRPQTAEAHEDAVLQVFSKAALAPLRRRHYALNDAMLRLLSRHMRLLSDYFAGVAFDAVPQRLAQRIAELVEGFGVEERDGITIATPLTQTELALMAGTTRQSVNEVLQWFRRDGVLTAEGRGLIVRDHARLLDIAGEGWRRISGANDRGGNDVR